MKRIILFFLYSLASILATMAIAATAAANGDDSTINQNLTTNPTTSTSTTTTTSTTTATTSEAQDAFQELADSTTTIDNNAAIAARKPRANQKPAAVESEESFTSKVSSQVTGKSSGTQPKGMANIPKTLRDEAFKQVINRAMPMRPDQIISFRRELEKSKQAVATPVYNIPMPVSSTLTVDLAPGSASPVIRLAAGYVSAIVFLDSTGQPWPIADYSLGNSKDFNIQWDQKTNTMFMQSTRSYATGNMAIRLAKLDTPITLSLVTAQKEVDFRIDLHVKAKGPKALATEQEDILSGSGRNNHLISILDGIPPEGSQVVDVSGDNGQAWALGDKLFFRTRSHLLSPAWSAKVSSADGTKVYEINKTPIALVSRNGKPIEIAFKGI